jgi:hypothetical protein
MGYIARTREKEIAVLGFARKYERKRRLGRRKLGVKIILNTFSRSAIYVYGLQ